MAKRETPEPGIRPPDVHPDSAINWTFFTQVALFAAPQLPPLQCEGVDKMMSKVPSSQKIL